MNEIKIVVYGRPAPQGSKRHVGHGVMVESSQRIRPWRDAVRSEAVAQTEGHVLPIVGPVAVEATFTVPRPKSAPKRRRTWPVTRSSGDVDKLARGCFDALVDAGVLTDDSQVVILVAAKDFVGSGSPDCLDRPGAVIRIKAIDARLTVRPFDEKGAVA